MMKYILDSEFRNLHFVNEHMAVTPSGSWRATSRGGAILTLLDNLFEFFRIEFYRIYRIYRICRKLFLGDLKMKKLLKVVFYKFYRFCRF